MIAGWVVLGGALGALSRFGVITVMARHERWPGWVAIVLVNLIGCMLIGIGAGAIGHAGWMHALAMTGFCGALTTFSSFALDVALLIMVRAWRSVLICVGFTMIAGPILTWLGWQLAHELGHTVG